MAETEYSLPRPSFDAPVKVLLVVAPFYRDIADMLIRGATAEIEAAGGTHETVEVPGALEIPAAIGMADRLTEYDAHVALGCVIRGATTHYETVCNDSSRGLTLLGLQGTLVGNGILTVENREQALERADPERMNKGGGAAAAALHLVALGRKWGGRRPGVGFLPGPGKPAHPGDGEDTPQA
ncbi:6,7-dimethyl-8-ribityllumazine synthase [Roseovarius salis]|uniref:6,7-dimethyl-8-ribityllumazine synthase n=1 Tax=Roseovarius salis TaxID=3376063 RepID=UPI0037CC7F80